MNLRKNVEIDVVVSVDDLASMFMELNSKDQADFFMLCQYRADRWDTSWCQQMAYVMDDLNDKGRQFLETIANHIRGD